MYSISYTYRGVWFGFAWVEVRRLGVGLKAYGLPSMQVTVLHDSDVLDPLTFIEQLRGSPYYLKIDGQLDAIRRVRRLGVAVVDEAMQLPLAHLKVYKEMAMYAPQ